MNLRLSQNAAWNARWSLLVVGTFASVLGGCFFVVWNTGYRCDGLTFNVMVSFIPVSGYAIFNLCAYVVLDRFSEKEGSFIVFHAIYCFFFLSVLWSFFPEERWFNRIANCSNNGENYFANIYSPFALTMAAFWYAFMLLDYYLVKPWSE